MKAARLAPRSLHDSRTDADDELDTLVPRRAKALRLSEPASGDLGDGTSRAVVSASSKDALPDLSRLTPEARANVEAKVRFRNRVKAVLGSDQSVADVALFFGEKRTKYHERIRLKRTDLAPLDEWFEKLNRYEDFEVAIDEFLRTA